MRFKLSCFGFKKYRKILFEVLEFWENFGKGTKTRLTGYTIVEGVTHC